MHTFKLPIINFQADEGGEFHKLEPQFKRLGILFRYSCPATPQQNDVAQRKNWHIADKVLLPLPPDTTIPIISPPYSTSPAPTSSALPPSSSVTISPSPPVNFPTNSSTELTPLPSPVPSPPPTHVSAPITTTHPMVTRSKVGIDPTSPHYIPSSFSEAIKYLHWKQAMTEEYNTLMHNHTWSLVTPSPSQNVIGSKWIFCVKLHPDGTIERYKARLVTQGFK
ncbi:hypothetical protein LIER_21864 [Lithospermum erythrorhizon]|uniref:Mitochondrial protein n=1 Tax=Lithospermum erythrorhizon TaxID=34254 RepID=A0AAV3QTA8_LITER